MKLNGHETTGAMLKPFIGKPGRVVGDKITLLFGDETIKIAGCRALKKGRYVITAVREPFMCNIPGAKVYVFKCDRKNASYEWVYSTESIDYLVSVGLITVS